MQRSTISMFAQLVQLMGGKIEFHQGLRMNLFVNCRLARYFKLNLMTCKCLLHWLNQPDIKEWEKPPKLAQLSLFD